MKVILGIGNPGDEYAGTRHNIGFDVLDRLAARFRGRFRPRDRWGSAAVIRAFGERACLVKPSTFVNRSGLAAEAALAAAGSIPLDLLVVCDDLALPPGKIRIRVAGSAGGHNGLQSILESLGTDGFPRLRIGVGSPPPGVDAADYVLERAPKAEALALSEACERAVDAISLWLQEGRLDVCMNRYNA